MKSSSTVLAYCILLTAFLFPGVFAQGGKLNFAVMNIKNGSGVSVGETDIIADRLRVKLFETGCANIMERDQMSEILKEQGFQHSGACTDEACMVEIGQLLGVQRLVSGSIGKLGSMFLVNFRSIDVQTARIVKVVSVDIKGGIEDVVDKLPGISQKLIGQECGVQPAPKEPEPVVVEEPREEEEEEVEVEVVDADKKDKNANRKGLRLVFNMYPGGMNNTFTNTTTFEEQYSGVVADSVVNEFDSYYLGDSARTISSSPVYHPQLKFIIRAGRFIAIDIGPGVLIGSQEFASGMFDTTDYGTTYTTEEHLRLKYISPGVCLGVNFVYRLFPLKINAGGMVDLGLLFVGKTISYEPEVVSYWGSRGVDVGYVLGFGGRVGAEILAGPNVGFAFDLLVKGISGYVEMDSGTEYQGPDGNGNYYNVEWTLEHYLSHVPIGLGVSVNFYF